ncbi:MAG: hypothetical protein AAF840_08745, partial [Bacteroidota bacterium]
SIGRGRRCKGKDGRAGEGDRPIVVLTNIAGSEQVFVLDGHHKLTAYLALKIPPKTLLISKLDAKRMLAEEGSQVLGALTSMNEDLLRIYNERT